MSMRCLPGRSCGDGDGSRGTGDDSSSFHPSECKHYNPLSGIGSPTSYVESVIVKDNSCETISDTKSKEQIVEGG